MGHLGVSSEKKPNSGWGSVGKPSRNRPGFREGVGGHSHEQAASRIRVDGLWHLCDRPKGPKEGAQADKSVVSAFLTGRGTPSAASPPEADAWSNDADVHNWVNYSDLTRPNSPQMVVYVGISPPTTVFQVGELL